MWAALLAALETIPALRDILAGIRGDFQKLMDARVEQRITDLEKKHESFVEASVQMALAKTSEEKDNAILQLTRNARS